MSSEALYEEYLAPPWSEPSRREREFLDSGELLVQTLSVGEAKGRLWRANGPSKGTILLAHGWAGRSATWLVLAPLLNERGYDAIAFDAPGHGETRGVDGAARTNFFLFAETLLAAARALPPPGAGVTPRREDGGFHAVIGHSIGACAVPYALGNGLIGKRAVLISPTAHTESFLTRWALARSLSAEDVAAVKRHWLAEFGLHVTRDTDPVLRSREMSIPALILHDAADAEAPIEDGRLLAEAWPGAILQETTCLGHRRILLSRAAMSGIVDFVDRA